MFFGIRDPGWEKIRIRDKHPGSATLPPSHVVYPNMRPSETHCSSRYISLQYVLFSETCCPLKQVAVRDTLPSETRCPLKQVAIRDTLPLRSTSPSEKLLALNPLVFGDVSIRAIYPLRSLAVYCHRTDFGLDQLSPALIHSPLASIVSECVFPRNALSREEIVRGPKW